MGDLRGLSEEELRLLEGQERINLEARVQCLRDIQTLLNAAVLQMQQYVSAVNVQQTSGYVLTIIIPQKSFIVFRQC